MNDFEHGQGAGGAPASQGVTLPVEVCDIPGPTGRWWRGVLVGSVVALPLAWLLSYAAALPFYLGLFFFMLFGLMIGAAVYRVAAPGRPFAKGPLLAGTTLLVAMTFGLSLWKEAKDFPSDVARRVVERAKDLGGKTAGEYRDAVAEDVRTLLSSRYGPGATWGYIRWVLTKGEFGKGELATIEKAVTLPGGQTRAWWAFRVVASMALLAFGIASQTLTLQATKQQGKGKQSVLRSVGP